MKGILVVNGFVREAGFLRLHAALLAAAQRRGVGLTLCPHDGLLLDAALGRPVQPLPKADFCIFWDKDIRLAAQLERQGLRLFNSAAAIALCDDKSLTHMALARWGVPQPETVLVPTTYPHVGYGEKAFLDRAIAYLGLPLILKACRGSFGAQVYLAGSRAEAAALLDQHEGEPMLLQRFISGSVGRDLRIYIAGERVMAAMRRSNPGDFRANIAAGGSAEPCTPTAAEAALALRCTRLLGLDFAGVDLLFGPEGPLLCEVNSNAHFNAIAEATGVDIAGAIIEHIAGKTAR